jgi:hypothetical protein
LSKPWPPVANGAFPFLRIGEKQLRYPALCQAEQPLGPLQGRGLCGFTRRCRGRPVIAVSEVSGHRPGHSPRPRRPRRTTGSGSHARLRVGHQVQEAGRCERVRQRDWSGRPVQNDGVEQRQEVGDVVAVTSGQQDGECRARRPSKSASIRPRPTGEGSGQPIRLAFGHCATLCSAGIQIANLSAESRHDSPVP